MRLLLIDVSGPTILLCTLIGVGASLAHFVCPAERMFIVTALSSFLIANTTFLIGCLLLRDED